MKKTETLKDGTQVVVRSLTLKDLDKIMEFYRSIPDKDRRYLRVDVLNKDVVKHRIDLTKEGQIVRLVALHEDEIIADGTLEFSVEEWKKHQAELRVNVAKPFKHKGLGTIMLRELYSLAAANKVEKVVVRFMRPQAAARNICRKLGFHEEIIIPDYVRDQKGKTHDMVIMTADMTNFWKELEHFYTDSDWRRHR
ncbi:MAG: GNAT family N-acetyltransferase [Candidatus Aminicenantes bacterium]|nr:GNAT family N-acetyltransferase [Candidatus Aminicenantes bacterium]